MNKYKRLLEKSERILKKNMYSEMNYPWSPYRMISPDKDFFKGVWNWDSAFHAIGMMDLDVEIAKEQIMGFLQFQMENGMLPDVVFEDGRIEDHLTKPPVMADAAVRIFKKTGDFDFLEHVYLCMVRNEAFWTEFRCREGLFHYDADKSDGCTEEVYKTRVGWESGWDNSPRWDRKAQNLWAIDLNCFMVNHYRALDFMTQMLGKDRREWKEKEQKLIQRINAVLWNEKMGAYNRL